MKITNLNIRLGGCKRRNPLILDYLLKTNSDLIILTEFIYNESGKQIIEELESINQKTMNFLNGELRNLSADCQSFCSNPRFTPLLVLAICTPNKIINF